MLSKRLAALLLIVASTAHGQPGPDPVLPSVVTLDKALEVFHAHGFDLLIAEAQVMSAEGDLRTARQVNNPNLGYSFSHVFNYDPTQVCPDGPDHCSPNINSLTLGDNAAIEDVLSGKRGLRIDVARRALSAARMARSDGQRVLELQVKQLYFQMAQGQRSLTFALEVQQRMDEYLDLTQKRFKLGAINEADEARVEIDKLEADQAVDVASQTLRIARVQLAFLLGLRGATPEFAIEPTRINFAVPPSLATATPESLLRDAFEHRPDLRGVHLQRERAEASVRLAKRLRFPDLNLQLGFSYAAPGGAQFSSNTVPPTLAVGISGNVPLFYQQQGEIKKAEADVRAQAATVGKTEAQVAADVQGAFVNFTSTRQLVQRMESRLLERAQTALDKVLLQRTQGQASGLEVSAARRQFVATSVEYLTELANYWIAVAQLEAAVGMELMK